MYGILYFSVFEYTSYQGKYTDSFSPIKTEQLKEIRENLIKDSQLFKSFLIGIFIFISIIFLISIIYYTISKLLKKDFEYAKLLILTKNSMIFYLIIIILSTILSNFSIIVSIVFTVFAILYTQKNVIFILKNHLNIKHFNNSILINIFIYLITLILCIIIIVNSLIPIFKKSDSNKPIYRELEYRYISN